MFGYSRVSFRDAYLYSLSLLQLPDPASQSFRGLLLRSSPPVATEGFVEVEAASPTFASQCILSASYTSKTMHFGKITP